MPCLNGDEKFSQKGGGELAIAYGILFGARSRGIGCLFTHVIGKFPSNRILTNKLLPRVKSAYCQQFSHLGIDAEVA